MKLFGVVLGSVLVVALAGAAQAAPAHNKCGCYKDTAGTCFCDKKAKCGCPGDCEPKGCEEQRDKDLQKEIDAETKKAAASDHRKPADDSSSRREESPAPKASAGHKMSAPQSKQLAKLLDLYLGDHPDARGKPIEDVRSDVSGH
jgi:pyruvate/2-oxoglutarate dehydrogenase complex dihydrolipoamide acyltransferase (E2) component